MRLSIWQQFSSNHSASFTVIGQFTDRQSAAKAAAELHHILQTALNWIETHPELADKWTHGDFIPPTEPELQFSKEYGVEWTEYALPWYWQAKVITHDTLVFLDSDGQADDGAFPFNHIMEKLGGQTFLDGDLHYDGPNTEIVAAIFCTAPDERTAEILYAEISPYFTSLLRDVWGSLRASYKAVPWTLYGTRFELPYVRNVLSAVNNNPHDQPIEVYREITKAVIALLGDELPNADKIKQLAASYSRLSEYGYDVFVDGEKLADHLDDIVRTCLLYLRYGLVANITRSGAQLELNHITGNMAHGLTAFLHYLKDKGCTNFRYSFAIVPDEE